MVTSPTEKGVVVIGGTTNLEQPEHIQSQHYPSHDLLELSGDSLASLKWRILKQKLHYARQLHVSFPIPGKVIAKLYFDGKYCPFDRKPYNYWK